MQDSGSHRSVLCYVCHVKLPHDSDAGTCLIPRTCVFLLIWRTILHSLKIEVKKRKSDRVGLYHGNNFINNDNSGRNCLSTLLLQMFQGSHPDTACFQVPQYSKLTLQCVKCVNSDSLM